MDGRWFSLLLMHLAFPPLFPLSPKDPFLYNRFKVGDKGENYGKSVFDLDGENMIKFMHQIPVT